MTYYVACALFLTGILHLLFGCIKFKKPLAKSLADGFINQFKDMESYAAFWFLMLSLPLMLSGHLAIRAATQGDLHSLKIIGIYTLVSSVIGIAAFPKSPFWLPASLSVFLLLAGNG